MGYARGRAGHSNEIDPGTAWEPGGARGVRFVGYARGGAGHSNEIDPGTAWEPGGARGTRFVGYACGDFRGKLKGFARLRVVFFNYRFRQRRCAYPRILADWLRPYSVVSRIPIFRRFAPAGAGGRDPPARSRQ